MVKGRVAGGKLYISMYDQRTDSNVEVEYKGVWGNLEFAGLIFQNGPQNILLDSAEGAQLCVRIPTDTGHVYLAPVNARFTFEG